MPNSADLLVHGRSAERGAKVVQEIQNVGGSARFIGADLGHADDVRRLAAAAARVDIVINNAGVYKFGATVDTDDAFFDEHININLRAPYILVQQLVPVWPSAAAASSSISEPSPRLSRLAPAASTLPAGRRGTAHPRRPTNSVGPVCG